MNGRLLRNPRRRAVGFAVIAVGFALGGGIACNAILGNEPGHLEPGTDAAETDAAPSSDAGCGGGTKQCVGICVSIEDAAVGCSGSCSACPPYANGAPTCTLQNSSFVCALGVCSPPFKDCDNDAGDGCETPVTTKRNCGSCGIDCDPLPFCVVPDDGGSAACSATCPPAPYQDCCPSGPCTSPNDPSGECVNLQDDPTNCGSCGSSCATQFPNATTTCTGGACQILACSAGFHLCGGQCVGESDTSCGAMCVNCTQMPGTPVCQSGTCVACPGSQVYCGPGVGCHDEDQNHCGTACADCGGGTCDPGTHTCTGGTSCSSPSIACTAACCTGDCIDPTSPATCGADGTMSCGKPCDIDAGIVCCNGGAIADPIVHPPSNENPSGGYHCGTVPHVCP